MIKSLRDALIGETFITPITATVLTPKNEISQDAFSNRDDIIITHGCNNKDNSDNTSGNHLRTCTSNTFSPNDSHQCKTVGGEGISCMGTVISPLGDSKVMESLSGADSNDGGSPYLGNPTGTKLSSTNGVPSSLSVDNNNNNNNINNNTGIANSAHPPPSDSSMMLEILRLGLPASMGTLLSFGTQTITLSFIGRRLGSDLFAKFSVGLSMFNLVGFSIGYGMIAGLDTLVAQSFGRYRQASNEISDYLQRAILVVICFMAPFSIFTLYCDPLMITVFGLEVGVVVSQFLRSAIPYLFFAMFTSTFTKVLQSINEPLLPTISMAVGCTCCYFLNLNFTRSSINEALYCLTVTYAVVSILLILICMFHPRVTFCRRGAKWPSPRLLDKEGFREFFAVGLPSLLSCVAEWWAFEVLQIIAASVSIQRVAELNLMLAVNSVLFSLAIGISVAASVKVGNALGENRCALAKRYATASIRLCQLLNGFNIFIVIYFRRYISTIFTNEEELQKGFEVFVFALATFHFGDSNQYLMQGIFRGAGRQADTVVPVLSSLWLIGLPLSYILSTTYNHGVFGIFAGLVIGFVVEMLFLVRRFIQWDWTRLGEVASRGRGGKHVV